MKKMTRLIRNLQSHNRAYESVSLISFLSQAIPFHATVSHFFNTKFNNILLYNIYLGMSRDSTVSITTGYGLDDRGVGVRVPIGSRIFFTSSRPALGPIQPPIQWVTGALIPEVKRQGREADHSPPTSVEVKKICIYTSTPP
jgi:hypothetical protein